MTEREYYREEHVAADPGPERYVREEVRLDPAAPAPIAGDHSIVRERVVAPEGVSTAYSERVYEPSPTEVQLARSARVRQVVYFIAGVISVLLIIRFILLLFGANQSAPFVSFMYNLTWPFMAPFSGIFGDPVYGQSVFEWSALVAIAMYMLLAVAVVKVVNLVMRPPTAEPL